MNHSRNQWRNLALATLFTAGTIIGIVACSDEDGDGAELDEEIKQGEQELDETGEEISEELDEAERELEDG